jgi:GAF domain-containing protein
VEAPGQRELTAVREIVHAFLHADRPEEAFQFALDRVGPVIGASFASVYLVEGASELMRLVAAHNWPERLKPWLADVRVRVGFGPSGEAASERRVIEVPDVFADPDLEDWQEVARELEFRAIVSLPLQLSGATLGAVTFYFRQWDDFTPDRRGLLRLVADVMAGAAEKAQLIDRVRRAEAAASDLQGDLDRRYGDDEEVRRSRTAFIQDASDVLMRAVEFAAQGPAGAERARHVVADLALVAAVATGTAELDTALFDPRAPLHAAIRSVIAGDPSIRVLAETPVHAVPVVKSDQEKMTRVLARLIERAAADAPGGEVRTGVFVVGDRVEYRVPDNGRDDASWRMASAILRLLGVEVERGTDPEHRTVAIALPTARAERARTSGEMRRME